nr:hypothetical protein [Tanacetum cinerariifolium]
GESGNGTDDGSGNGTDGVLGSGRREYDGSGNGTDGALGSGTREYDGLGNGTGCALGSGTHKVPLIPLWIVGLGRWGDPRLMVTSRPSSSSSSCYAHHAGSSPSEQGDGSSATEVTETISGEMVSGKTALADVNEDGVKRRRAHRSCQWKNDFVRQTMFIV